MLQACIMVHSQVELLLDCCVLIILLILKFIKSNLQCTDWNAVVDSTYLSGFLNRFFYGYTRIYITSTEIFEFIISV